MAEMENIDYDIQEFDLDDLVDALAENEDVQNVYTNSKVDLYED